MCCSTPSPPHFGQAPNGLLNENSRGSISGMVKPDTGQANFSEKMSRSAAAAVVDLCDLASPRARPAPSPLAGEGWEGVERAAHASTPLPSLRRRIAPMLAASREFRHREAVGELQRLLERVREPRRDVGPHHDAVDHHVDVVVELLVERRHVGDLVEFAVDLHALVAALQELGELLAVLALAAAHHRRQQVEPRAFRQRQDAVDHLRDGLAFDRQPGGGRVGNADARPEEPHVVVDLGDGADRGARVLRGGLLLDGDGRRQAVDLVDVRLLHHFKELPGVGGEALHIAALAFGIDGVERQRGFARAGKAGEHHQLVARNGDVDVLEVVLARPADGDHAGIGTAVDLDLSNRSVIGAWRLPARRMDGNGSCRCGGTSDRTGRLSPVLRPDRRLRRWISPA